MTVSELRAALADLPDDMEVGVESSIRVGTTGDDALDDRDDLDGHEVREGYVMDFTDEGRGQKVFLLCITRDESATGRWSGMETAKA